MWALARTINDCLNEKALDERILEQVFETYWPQFNEKFQLALKENQPEEIVPPRSEQDMLGEILNHTRGLSNRVRSLESELNYRSNSNSLNKKIDFDKRVKSKILNMLESGKYTKDQIADSLVDYDMPDSYAQDLVEKMSINYKFNPRRSVDGKVTQ